MAAGVANIYIEQYEYWTGQFRFYQDTEQTIPVDFTGYSNPKLQIRSVPSSPEIIASATAFIVSGGIDAELSGEQTGSIIACGQDFREVTRLVYDLVVDNPAGNQVRLSNGAAFISPGVSR